MTPGELLADFAVRGIRLSHHGPELHVAPRALLEADDRTAIATHKPALLTLLATLEELERDGTAEKLRAVAITPEEHVRLRAEAAAGDRLAELITAVLATTEGR